MQQYKIGFRYAGNANVEYRSIFAWSEMEAVKELKRQAGKIIVDNVKEV